VPKASRPQQRYRQAAHMGEEVNVDIIDRLKNYTKGDIDG